MLQLPFAYNKGATACSPSIHFMPNKMATGLHCHFLSEKKFILHWFENLKSFILMIDINIFFFYIVYVCLYCLFAACKTVFRMFYVICYKISLYYTF